jgi:hypothetical protein
MVAQKDSKLRTDYIPFMPEIRGRLFYEPKSRNRFLWVVRGFEITQAGVGGKQVRASRRHLDADEGALCR